LAGENEKLQNVAESAGFSREELKAKINKLAGLVTDGNFQLVADILAGAETPWLSQALLVGASITPDGDIKPGKTLRLFKKHADFVFLLVLAFMPEGLELDSSLHREAKIQAKLSDDSVGIVLQKIADRLPGLDIDGCPELFRFSYMLADLLRMTSHLSESARRALESPYAWEKIGVQWNMMRNGFRTNVEVWQRDWGIAKANECICESLIEKNADV
jgi:hypothetical protein